jgi:hypothetical protein
MGGVRAGFREGGSVREALAAMLTAQLKPSKVRARELNVSHV